MVYKMGVDTWPLELVLEQGHFQDWYSNFMCFHVHLEESVRVIIMISIR